jgi:hypothetical protein
MTLAIAIALAAISVPRSLADTSLHVLESPLPFLTLTMTVEGKGTRTFLVYPAPDVTVTLVTTPPQFRFNGPLLPADPGASSFQFVFSATGNPKSKIDEVKGQYAFKYSSRKDPPLDLHGTIEFLVSLIDFNLPTPWLGVSIATNTVKMNGKVKRSRAGDGYDAKFKIAFTGLTYIGAPVKGAIAVNFAQAPVAP